MKDEAAAKRTLRKAFERQYPGSFTWTNTDAFRHGLPDFFVAYGGKTVAVEAKFIQTLPKRKSSMALKHPVSAAQVAFLTRYVKSGSPGVVLIGLEDVFAYTSSFKENYTLEEVLSMPRIEKNLAGEWDLARFWVDSKNGFGKHKEEIQNGRG